MREPLRDPARLEHIAEAIENVIEFYPLYKNDGTLRSKATYFAIVKNIEIIGEASYMLSKDFKEAHPQTPWPEIEAMRHFLVHGYYNVKKSHIENVIEKDLPPLKEQIEDYRKEMEK